MNLPGLGSETVDQDGNRWLVVSIYADGSTREVKIPEGETAEGYNRTWGPWTRVRSNGARRYRTRRKP